MLKTALNTNIIPHPKTQQRHRQRHIIQAYIPPLSNCNDTGEKPSSLHNSKQTKHTHIKRKKNTTLSSNGTTHIKQHRSKGVQPNGTLCAKNHCNMSKAFYTINIHTSQKAATDQHSMHNQEVHSKLHQETQNLHNIKHPHNVNSKLAFHKVASFHQQYSTFSLQSYHHPEHRFTSWPGQMTSPSHLHAQSRVQPRNT